MSVSLKIDKSACTQCGKCVKVCPSGVLLKLDRGSVPQVDYIGFCIGCGHCAAVCPNGSIVHSLFPKEKIHAIDRATMPSPEQVMLLCKARRSNRSFTDKPVPFEYLDMILKAAHRAPTGGNLQQVGFTLVTDPVKLRYLVEITMNVFGRMIKKLQNPLLKPLLSKLMPNTYKSLPLFISMQEAMNNGSDPILRGATALILIHTPESDRFGIENSNIAYQNGSLMAESLNVSQVYTGFLNMAARQDKRIMKYLRIKGKIHAGMALGMPKFIYPNYIDKKEINLNIL